MAYKEELIQFNIVNNTTDCVIDVPLFSESAPSINATTKYQWQLITADLSCGCWSIIINSQTYYINFDGTLVGLQNAFNNLGFGFACTTTIGADTFLYTLDNTNIYGAIDTCYCNNTTTSTTTTTTTLPITTTTTTTTTTLPITTTTTTTTTTLPITTTTTTTTTTLPITTSTTTTTTTILNIVTIFGVSGTTILGEAILDIQVGVTSNVSIDTSFNITVQTSNYGTIGTGVTILSGTNFGTNQQSLGLGSAPVVTSSCIASCDNPTIDFTPNAC